MWLEHELSDVVCVNENLNGEAAQRTYDQIADCLTKPEFRPRRMFERFNIEVLTTTDAAHDPLVHHKAIRESGWKGRVAPTFRPDGVVNIDRPDWRENLAALGEICGFEITSYKRLIEGVEHRPAVFKSI